MSLNTSHLDSGQPSDRNSCEVACPKLHLGSFSEPSTLKTQDSVLMAWSNTKMGQDKPKCSPSLDSMMVNRMVPLVGQQVSVDSFAFESSRCHLDSQSCRRREPKLQVLGVSNALRLATRCSPSLLGSIQGIGKAKALESQVSSRSWLVVGGNTWIRTPHHCSS